MKARAFFGVVFGVAIFSPFVFAHEGASSAAPWGACEDKQRSNICAFTNSHEDIYKGTCQVMADSLYCVRNQPIIRAEDLEFGLLGQESENQGEHVHDEAHNHH